MDASTKTRQDSKSSTSLAESSPQNGQSEDAVLDLMKQYNMPMDRATYLELAYMGNPPEEIDPELSVRLDEIFGSIQ